MTDINKLVSAINLTDFMPMSHEAITVVGALSAGQLGFCLIWCHHEFVDWRCRRDDARWCFEILDITFLLLPLFRVPEEAGKSAQKGSLWPARRNWANENEWRWHVTCETPFWWRQVCWLLGEESSAQMRHPTSGWRRFSADLAPSAPILLSLWQNFQGLVDAHSWKNLTFVLARFRHQKILGS